ncbi:DUF4326 domain-containing protein, partial [Stieleria sp.]|uniref:DUF4326 domain-containing protein n=1 Tax=Stieleria sp. TaxID=2795976 RepID=UPI00356210D9
MTPTRHQRRRTKGYRMPPGVVYVGRPGKWGNPFNDAHTFRITLRWLINHPGRVDLLGASKEQVGHMR